jgi:TRAP-type C4-dicarboxylate transport system permease small subunit
MITSAGDFTNFRTGQQAGPKDMEKLILQVERIAIWTAWVGGFIVVVQMVWISYGVFVRYGLGKPDRMVTEATALLLFPVAFAGLAYALREDAYPKVTFLTDLARPSVQRLLDIVNHGLMFGVGLFFSYAGISATVRAFYSGASSEILGWPRYAFWFPGALALIIFTIYVGLRLARLILTYHARET